MKNTFGSAVAVTIFGESHGPAVGAVLDGLAPGLAVDEKYIAAQMDKRRAAGAISTGRQEADAVEILSGVYKGYTTGTPLCLVVHNKNTRSADYAATQHLLRPGHADYTSLQKYLGYADPRGGGHFSGRLTAPLVAAGALCRRALAGRGISIGTQLARCAGIDDAPLPSGGAELAAALDALNAKSFATLDDDSAQRMQDAILAAKAEGDSVGGILQTIAIGLPAGVGEPFFSSAESVLSALYFSIPGVKGVEFGGGFALAEMRGSEANDAFVLHEGKVATQSNNNGGLNGGISNGMPLVARIAVKPTPSLAKPQRTVDVQTHTEATLELVGRHDPCILHRARAVADAVTAIGLLDLCTQRFGTLWQRGDTT